MVWRMPQHVNCLLVTCPGSAGVVEGLGRWVLGACMQGYWGGGSVFLATSALDWHFWLDAPHSMEHGTLAFLDIIALRHGEGLRMRAPLLSACISTRVVPQQAAEPWAGTRLRPIWASTCAAAPAR